MTWDELEVEGDLAPDEVRRAVAAAFALPAFVCESWDAPPATGGAPSVLIELTRRPGSFPLTVGLYLVGAAAPPRDRASLHLELARSLGRRILVSDESPDPFRRLAIEPNGATHIVDLDVEALDRGSLEIARVHFTRATPNARLVRLGLAHLVDDPDALRAELERRAAADEIRAREVEREMEDVRSRLGVRAPSLEPVAPPAAPLAEYPRGRKSSTLLVATRTPGSCRACRHANQGTVDMSEGHVFCQIDHGVKALEHRCDVARPLPRTPAELSGDQSAWATYYFHEPYDGTNGTWCRLQDSRLMVEDADDAIRRSLRADIPFIEAMPPAAKE